MNFPPAPLFPARRRAAARLLAGLGLGLLASCASDAARLADHEAAARQRWRELSAVPERTVAVLDWDEAGRRLAAGNLKLRQAREAVRAGEEAVRQVPYNYIPELSLNAFAYPTVRTLGDGRLGDTYLFLGGIVSLPDPVRYRAEALQARLQFMTAQVDAALLRRDLEVRLYHLFRRGERLGRTDAEANALARLTASRPDAPAAAQARELARRNRADWAALETDLAELLGDYTRRWRPGAGRPELDYTAHAPALDGRDGFAALHLTRAALQLLALDAQRQGLLTAEWPQLSVLLTAPPIYQRSAGRESYLSLGDLRVSGFVSYGTDFRGTRALVRTQAARRSELARHELDVGLQAAMTRLRDSLGLLGELQARRAGLHAAESALQRADAVGEAAGLRQQEEELTDEIDDLNLSFWVLDDPRWPTTT